LSLLRLTGSSEALSFFLVVAGPAFPLLSSLSSVLLFLDFPPSPSTCPSLRSFLTRRIPKPLSPRLFYLRRIHPPPAKGKLSFSFFPFFGPIPRALTSPAPSRLPFLYHHGSRYFCPEKLLPQLSCALFFPAFFSLRNVKEPHPPLCVCVYPSRRNRPHFISAFSSLSFRLYERIPFPISFPLERHRLTSPEEGRQDSYYLISCFFR